MIVLSQSQQLDKKLANLSSLKNLIKPRLGWISAIRKALGMSANQLATRVKLTPARIQQIEKGEVAATLKLETLEKIAQGLNCDLHYVLLPKANSFKELLKKQAKKIAQQTLETSAQHMMLEDQLAAEDIKDQINFLAEELLHNKLKLLWNDEN